MKFIFAILAAGIPWLLVTVAPSFPFYKEICEESYKSANHYCAGYDAVLFALFKVGEFVKSYEVAITAVATIVLAVFTWRLWWSTEKLWKTTEASIHLAREEFSASHPPRLIIRWIYWKTVKGVGAIQDTQIIEFEISNVGGSVAKNVEVNTRLWYSMLPPIPPYSDIRQLIPDSLVSAGAYSRVIHYPDEIATLVRAQKEIGFGEVHDRGQIPFYFLGYIIYEDALGIKRRTAFCRIYDPSCQRFVKMENPDEDYEHAD